MQETFEPTFDLFKWAVLFFVIILFYAGSKVNEIFAGTEKMTVPQSLWFFIFSLFTFIGPLCELVYRSLLSFGWDPFLLLAAGLPVTTAGITARTQIEKLAKSGKI